MVRFFLFFLMDDSKVDIYIDNIKSDKNKIKKLNTKSYPILDEQMLVYIRGNCRSCWARYLCGGTYFYGSKVVTGDCLDIEPVECILKKHLAERCLDLLVFMREHNIDIYKLY